MRATAVSYIHTQLDKLDVPTGDVEAPDGELLAHKHTREEQRLAWRVGFVMAEGECPYPIGSTERVAWEIGRVAWEIGRKNVE